jgi:hypothetical protein
MIASRFANSRNHGPAVRKERWINRGVNRALGSPWTRICVAPGPDLMTNPSHRELELKVDEQRTVKVDNQRLSVGRTLSIFAARGRGLKIGPRDGALAPSLCRLGL